MPHTIIGYRRGQSMPLPFDTYDGSGGSCTITGLAVTDIEVYKNGGTTQRSSDNGYSLPDTDGIDFDGSTGLHGIVIDTGDNSVAGFWEDGNTYWVHINAITVDGQTVRFTYLVLLGFMVNCEPRTWHVAASGGSATAAGTRNEPLTLAAALLFAQPGDTIRGADGTYSQGSTMLEITTDDITITGDGDGMEIAGSVDGYGTGASLVRVSANNVTLRKLFVNNTHADGYGIDTVSTTYGLRLDQVKSFGGVDGVVLINAHNAVLNDVRASSEYDGALFTTCRNLRVSNCEISTSCSYDNSSAFRAFYAVNCTGLVSNCRIEAIRSTGSFTGKAHAVEQHTTTEQGWMTYENTHVIARVTNASGTTGAVRGFTTMDDGITFPWKSTIRGGSITTSNAGSGPNYNIDVNQTGSYVELQGVRMNGTINGSSNNVRNLDANVSDTLADTADMQPKMDVTLSTRASQSSLDTKPTAAEVATAVAEQEDIAAGLATIEEKLDEKVSEAGGGGGGATVNVDNAKIVAARVVKLGTRADQVTRCYPTLYLRQAEGPLPIWIDTSRIAGGEWVHDVIIATSSDSDAVEIVEDDSAPRIGKNREYAVVWIDPVYEGSGDQDSAEITVQIEVPQGQTIEAVVTIERPADDAD